MMRKYFYFFNYLIIFTRMFQSKQLHDDSSAYFLESKLNKLHFLTVESIECRL